MQFQQKLSLLLRKRGLSHRALAEKLGLSNASVSAWARGARPRPSVAIQVAEYFGTSVDDLLDDSRELPDEPTAQIVEEEQAAYGLALEPIKTAAALARHVHGPDAAAGQAAFERHLASLRAMRDQAERAHPRDPAAALNYFDTLLAAYIAGINPPQ